MTGAVYVGGTFDLFHAGHVEMLELAAQHGPVIASVNTDEFCARYKRKPIIPFDQRLEVVRACRYVDQAIRNVGHEDSGITIDALRGGYGSAYVKYIAHGDDWTGPSLLEQLGIDQEWLDHRGIEMLYLHRGRGVSTSEIIKRCSELRARELGELE